MMAMEMEMAPVYTPPTPVATTAAPVHMLPLVVPEVSMGVAAAPATSTAPSADTEGTADVAFNTPTQASGGIGGGGEGVEAVTHRGA